MAKKIVKGALFVCVLYILYAVATAVVLFYFPLEKKGDMPTNNVSEFMGKGDSSDRVLLLEDGYESGRARMQMIQEAEESIDIAYYSIAKGKSTELMLGALIDAADRGVKVRILLDGICHGLRFNMSDARYALASHENIELRYYESFKIFQPWTWNNRLHDKIMIADGKLGIIGGRNIADKYLAKKPPKNFVHDRDVIIFNAKQDKESANVQMKVYMNELWNHPYTSDPFSDLSKRQVTKGKKEKKKLASKYNKAIKADENFVTPSMKWSAITTSAKRVSFIRNPIERFKKQPVVWKTLIDLATVSDKSVLMQSPYVIPTKEMKKYVPDNMNSAADWTLLTNSVKSTPNVFAFSGYLDTREDIVQTGLRLYEYADHYSLHAKSVVYDQRISAVGSFNLDPRSSFLSTDSMVVIDSEEFAQQLTEAIDNKISSSTLVADKKEKIETPKDEKKDKSFKAIMLNALSKIAILWRGLV
ncbi:phosphatidylserine/phosphatidylglycerophosphate/cardiolipin synthase family protein [Peribacillus sp. NPDC097295]|uniref:phospholipase D-like domain-containing protein n=1 Tax=Peribacillus sp. NPDC097295 TaxID=3364402 RepID=UPI00380C412E